MKYKPFLLALTVLAGLLTGCVSTGVDRSGDIEVQPGPVTSRPPANGNVNLQPDDRTTVSQTPSPPPFQQTRAAFERSIYFTQPNAERIHRFLDTAQDYNIRSIQLGGDILNAVDEAIFNPATYGLVRDIATHADNVNVDTYVWSNEIHLEGQSFQFQWEAPLVIARQAAYRNFFQRVPEADGIILSFGQSRLAPWNANDFNNSPQPEKVRFVIEMAQKVVAGELKKRLVVQLPARNQPQYAWVTQAISGLQDRNITILASEPPESTFTEMTVWGFTDLTGSSEGAGSFLYCKPEQVAQWWGTIKESGARGITARVDAPSGSIIGNANEVNLYAVSKLASEDAPLEAMHWDEWIQKKYQILPISDEGRLLTDLLRNSYGYFQKIPKVKGVFTFTIANTPPYSVQFTAAPAMNPQTADYLRQELLEPNKQTLIDLAQESVEIVFWCNRAIQDMQTRLQGRLNRTDYDDISLRLERLRWYAGVHYYCRQVKLGTLFWQKNYDEEETLNIEYCLQALEGLSQQGARLFQSMPPPITPAAIDGVVHSVRAVFPKVLLGARERQWNRIGNISIQQTGLNALTVTWETERPSQSRIYVTQNLPVFDQIIDEGGVLKNTHRLDLQGIKPGEEYVLKIQCVDETGNTTNSGNYSITIPPSPIL